MGLYNRFASIYQKGPYVRFSQGLAESVLPEYLAELGVNPCALLDIACGEGSFAIEMAKLGYTVTDIDQSHEMITLAREQADKGDMSVNFLVEDMRAMPFENEFGLVTCLFDSLNYMLTVKDLHAAFKNAYHALYPGGFYIFDMNTIYGLAVDWMRQETYIQNETEDFIELHQQSFDYENQIATMEITVFERRAELWERFGETHCEHGYPIADIQFLLHEIGFEISGMYGSLKKRSDVQTNSPRVWFIAHKPV